MPSSVICSFAYDPRSKTLDVKFVSCRSYRYLGVPEAVAGEFSGAFSKGRFFNTRIRESFRLPGDRISVGEFVKFPHYPVLTGGAVE